MVRLHTRRPSFNNSPRMRSAPKTAILRLCWLLRTSVQKIGGPYQENHEEASSHWTGKQISRQPGSRYRSSPCQCEESEAMKRLSLRSVKLSFQRKTPKPCLSSSSEKHEKKGLRVRDF